MRLIFIFLVISTSLFSQKHDYVWLFGYDNRFIPEDSLWGNSVMDFNYSPPKISYDGHKNMSFNANAISVSNKEGNFLFSSNGNWLLNHENQPIEGVDFDFGENPDFKQLINPGSSYFIPLEDENQFGYLYSVHEFEPFFCGKNWWYAIVDMNKNNGFGEITFQENILSDTLELAKISGVKHGNGKDWWFLTKKYSSNHFFKILFDGKDFNISEQTEGATTIDGLGQALFSPDGTKYANASSISVSQGMYFDLYDFDRCSGELSNHVQGISNVSGFSGGIAFSPNSRFLYVTTGDKILQYDTWEEDVIRTKVVVAEYDGYVDSVFTSDRSAFALIPTELFLMQLAPNDKIYINVTNGSYMLHVIENPNEKGLACNVEQHSVRLPTPNSSIPAFPNYRLGALGGSPCDTIVEVPSNVYEIQSSNIKVFPNPTNGQIQVTWESPLRSEVSFLLYDVSGRVIFTRKFVSQGLKENIDLGDLSKGIYIYELNADNRTLKTDKLVVVE